MWTSCEKCHFNYEPNIWNQCPNCIKDPNELSEAWSNGIGDYNAPLSATVTTTFDLPPSVLDKTSYTKEYKPSNIESEYHKLVDYNASKGYDDWDLTYKQEFDDTTEVTKKAFEEWISKKGGGITGYKGDYESLEEKKKYKKKIEDFFKKMLEMDVPKKKSKKIDMEWEDSAFF